MDPFHNEVPSLAEAIRSLSVANEGISDVGDNDNVDYSSQDAPSSRVTTNTTSTASALTSNNSTTILNPIYIPTASGNDTWELTWPIWHMLPVVERKSIATQNGFKTIGDFEESVILSRALTQDDQPQVQAQAQVQPYSSDQLYEFENTPNNFGLPILAERLDDDDNESQSVEESSTTASDDEFEQNHFDGTEAQGSNNNQDQDIEHGGLILLLPHELVIHFILPFLPIEQYAVCALVSPHWKQFTRTEVVYKELCKRCYLQQSKRKTLHVHRFNGSYHTMLNTRYRVKTGCGFYVLKCTKIKKIQRDMWTEVPVGAVLESTYYRYMYFYENGTLLYALTSRPPHEMIVIFQKMKQRGSHSHESVNALLGKYEIQKDEVTVNVKHQWHHVKFVLKVLINGYAGSYGRFWALELEKHWSSQIGDFDEYWSRDLVEYKLPQQPIFRFLRDWRL